MPPPSHSFEEVDRRPTPLGELILRRRRAPALGNREIHEITLGGAFLMSSIVNESEIALATRALAARQGDGPARVLVGGLGLGYTARAALDAPNVGAVVVVEWLEPVIAWTRDGLVPLGAGLVADPRLEIRHDDFFALAAGDCPSAETWDAILVDIDHSPNHPLAPGNVSLYSSEGLARVAARLRPGGVFALWSADQPDAGLLARLATAFGEAWAEEIEFFNPMVSDDDRNTIYLARGMLAR